MTEFMFDVVNSIHLEDSMDEIEQSPFRNQLSEFVYDLCTLVRGQGTS